MILMSVFCVTADAYSEIIGNNFYTSGGWSGAGSVSGDILSISNTTSNAQGRVNHFTNLDSSADFSGGPNSATISAMNSHRFILRLRMSLSSIKEYGITSQLNLIDSAMGYTASTYLVQLKSNAQGTYNVYVNKNSNGKTEPATCVLENVAGGSFVNVLVDMYKDGADGWKAQYYINGADAGFQTFTSCDPSNATGLRFRVSNGTIAGTTAKFADFSLTAYETGETYPEAAVTDCSLENGILTMNFSTEISADSANNIFINDIQWEDFMLGNDHKSILLMNVPQEEFSVNVTDAYDIFGTKITDYSGTFGESQAEEEYVEPVFYQWVPYENFSNWTDTSSMWSAGNENTSPDSSVGSIYSSNGNLGLKLLTKGSASGMNRINKFAKDKVAELFESTEGNYKMVIKARACPTEYGASSSSNEISLSQGTSTKQRLFEITTTSLGEIKPKIHGADFLDNISLNQWVDVIITAQVKNGVADFVYFIDGVKHTGEYKYQLASNGINAIQFAQRGFAEGIFDDIEVYLFTGSNPSFEFKGITDINGNETDVYNPSKPVVLNFSAEISESNLISSGQDSIIKIDGISVPLNRLSIGGNKKSIVIAPDGTEWDPLKKHIVEIAGEGFSDIYGTLFTPYEGEISFTTGGWKLSANNGVFSKNELSDGNLKVEFDVKNMTGDKATVNVVIAQCKGDRSKYMITQLSESTYEVANGITSPKISAELNITDSENSFVMAFVYECKNFRPVLKEALILE